MVIRTIKLATVGCDIGELHGGADAESSRFAVPVEFRAGLELSPRVRRHRNVIQSHSIQQNGVVRMLPDGLHPWIIAQKDETVRAIGDGLIEQADRALLVADTEIRHG